MKVLEESQSDPEFSKALNWWTEERLASAREAKPKRCETCRFFDGNRSELRSAEMLRMNAGWGGRCVRRSPPWPTVAWDAWCGEFEKEEVL